MSPTLQTLLPVAAGITVVILGILVFKLHAFLALLLAAAVTAALTPQSVLLRHELTKRAAYDVKEIPPEHEYQNALEVEFKIRGNPEAVSSQDFYCVGFDAQENLRVVFDAFPYVLPDSPGPGEDDLAFTMTARKNMCGHTEGVWDPVEDCSYDPGDYLLPASALFEAEAAAARSVPTRIASAFGDMVGSIGMLIAFAAIIGMCLLDSGAADRIVRSALNVVGEKGAPLAFAGCGFLLGVPVFFDTVFLLMIPLGKALRLRTGRNYVLYVLTIFCGATMAHSLVPPTPGPLLVAEALGVEVGMMMFVGGAVGLITATAGIIYALIINRFIDVPLRDTPDMPLADLERLAAKPDHELPPLWLSLAPILIPVWLIAQQTALDLFLKAPPASLTGFAQQIPAGFVTAVGVLGEKNTAVAIGMVIALILLVWQTRQSLTTVRDRVGTALAAGGSIILITAAGGAFGAMIQQTGVASLLKQMPALGPAGLLSVAFLVTTAIRTTQGSATVAMITSVGLFAGLDLSFHAVWLALAIGCGSKPISWMTDSGFWVICKMSGMTEVETLKTLTPMTVVMGVVGLVVVIVGATLFPMT